MSTAVAAENAATQPPPSSNGATMIQTVIERSTALDYRLQQAFKKKFGDTTSSEPWRRKFAHVLGGWEILIDEFPRLLEATRSVHASQGTRLLLDELIKEERGWDDETKTFVPQHSHSILFRELTFALLSRTDPMDRVQQLAAMSIYPALKPLVEWAATEPVYGLSVIYAMYHTYETVKANLLKSANALDLTVLGIPPMQARSEVSDDIHTTMDRDESRGTPVTNRLNLSAEHAMYFAAHQSVVLQMDEVLAMIQREVDACSKCDEKTLTLVFEQLEYLLMLTFDLPMARAANA